MTTDTPMTEQERLHFHVDFHDPHAPEIDCRYCAAYLDERGDGLVLVLAFCLLAVAGGLLLALTTPVPLGGQHLAGLLLIIAGAGLAARALWVAGRRADRREQR